MKKLQKQNNAVSDKRSPSDFDSEGGGAVPPTATKICANPTCKKQFVPKNNKIKYCSNECAKRIHKYGQQIEFYINKPCEFCKQDHSHTYGSGRFCSAECKNAFNAEIKRTTKNPNVKKHLDKLRQNGRIKSKAPYGTWKCIHCKEIFETKHLLREHIKHVHLKNDNSLICPFCGKDLQNKYVKGGHIRNCKFNPNREIYKKIAKETGKKRSNLYKSGKLVPVWTGRKHSEESKQKMRKSTCKYLMENNPHPCRYNKNAIKFFDELSKKNGWNLQHAENGGEFYTGIGYWLDAYDKEKNIVVEYDEPAHYIDVENNILREKDLKRQNEIIEHLHCEYWRYNEKIDVLWKVQK